MCRASSPADNQPINGVGRCGEFRLAGQCVERGPRPGLRYRARNATYAQCAATANAVSASTCGWRTIGRNLLLLPAHARRLTHHEATATITIWPKPVWRNWQTRRIQNPLVATPCGFESLHRHLPPLIQKPLFLPRFMYVLIFNARHHAIGFVAALSAVVRI